MEYTLENMPRDCRTLYDVIYSHMGEPITIESMCFWMDLNAEFVKDRSKIKNLLSIIAEVEQNVWKSYARVERNDEMVFEAGDGIYMIKEEFFKKWHKTFCDSHKLLIIKCGRGNRVYELIKSYERKEHYYEAELQSQSYGMAHKLIEGIRRDYTIRLGNKSVRKILDIFKPLKDDFKDFLLNDTFPELSEGESIKGKPRDVNLTLCKKCGELIWDNKCPICNKDSDDNQPTPIIK
ncbi:hypothetical protein LCGC14_1940180 [marine sediment metagenome]|uniref:Uncharacterized protein n=1 Tax=marine sediment metagenome TaxID=412755 RepID=A0A0F9G911_9ZZZZ